MARTAHAHTAPTPQTTPTAPTAHTNGTADPRGARAPEPGSEPSNELVRRAAQSAHATIDRLAEQASPRVQHLQDSLDEASLRLHERADHLRELGQEVGDSMRSAVRRHPLTAIGTALALGLLLARLSR